MHFPRLIPCTILVISLIVLCGVQRTESLDPMTLMSLSMKMMMMVGMGSTLMEGRSDDNSPPFAPVFSLMEQVSKWLIQMSDVIRQWDTTTTYRRKRGVPLPIRKSPGSKIIKPVQSKSFNDSTDSAHMQAKRVQEIFHVFFGFISSIDSKTCFQKLICDIHARNSTGKSATVEKDPRHVEYESGLLNMFRMLKEFLAENENAETLLRREPEIAKYLIAAQHGTAVRSAKTCKMTYRACKYTPKEVMDKGISLTRRRRNHHRSKPTKSKSNNSSKSKKYTRN